MAAGADPTAGDRRAAALRHMPVWSPLSGEAARYLVGEPCCVVMALLRR